MTTPGALPPWEAADRAAILAHVRRHPPARTEAIAAALDRPTEYVHGHAVALLDQGLIAADVGGFRPATVAERKHREAIRLMDVHDRALTSLLRAHREEATP